MDAPVGPRPGHRAGLRTLLESDELIVAPGVLNPLTGRIAERLGYSACYLGGNAIGLDAAIAQPLVTLTETVDAIRRLRARVENCIIVDVGAGFGHATNIRRTVHECTRAGADALQIDDQPYPKSVDYHRGRGRLASLPDSADRIRVAAASRTDPETILIARTDALRVTGSEDEAVQRCHAYVEAGADVVMVLDLTPDGLSRLQASLPDVPVAWIGAVADAGPSLAELSSSGFRIAVYPFTTVGVIVSEVTRTWTALRDDGRLPPRSDAAWSLTEALALARIEENWAIEDRFTDTDERRRERD